MIERVLLWYRALTARERYLVLVAGVLAALTLGYLLIVPLNDALDSARARHADAVIALGETQGRVDAVKAAHAGRAAPLDVPLESVIRARANDAGFALASVVPQGQDRVQIAIASARPGALTGWIADLEAGGILVDRLTTTDNGDRTVAAQMTLKAQGAVTRFRLKSGPVALFGAVFALALVVLLPLRLVLGWFDLDRTGLSARAATGSVWWGALREAQVGGVALGDLNAGVSSWPLLVGRARIDLATTGEQPLRTLHGAISISRHAAGVDDLTASVPVGDVFAPFPVSALDLEEVSVRFAGNLCDKAEGRVKATLGGDIAGISLGQGLSGDARCDAGALLLPLVSQAGTEQVALRLYASGRYRAELTVKPGDPAAAAKLELSGFRATPKGYLLAVEGKF